ncbi:AAA family ATPase [Pimelobacter simplex]|uniref:AAA family ATPase n=1 Tax=Nocardioides simplex TaxID=2045 RepID=UPI003AAA51C9
MSDHDDELSQTDRLLSELADEVGGNHINHHLDLLVGKALDLLPPEKRRAAIARTYRDYPADSVTARFSRDAERMEVLRRARDLRLNELARQESKADQRAEAPAPVSLADLLAEPDEPVQYRIDKVWPVDGRVVLAAQNKTGKTTLVGNTIRSLVDGADFLAHYKVEPVERVVLIDDEMSRSKVRSWLKDQDIREVQRVEVVALRGALSSFDILDPAVRQQWADVVRGADVLVFDCLRPALDSLGLDENLDAGRFLVALDELCREAGVRELMLVHHMGHSNERSRGSSRIEDWPDVKWKLVREKVDDERSPRYFSAYGRDVDQPESRLLYDPFTRRFEVDPDGGTRAATKATELEQQVFDYVEANPGATQNAIETGVGGDNKTVRKAITNLAARGQLNIQPGKGRAKLHYVRFTDEDGNELI